MFVYILAANRETKTRPEIARKDSIIDCKDKAQAREEKPTQNDTKYYVLFATKRNCG